MLILQTLRWALSTATESPKPSAPARTMCFKWKPDRSIPRYIGWRGGTGSNRSGGKPTTTNAPNSMV